MKSVYCIIWKLIIHLRQSNWKDRRRTQRELLLLTRRELLLLFVAMVMVLTKYHFGILVSMLILDALKMWTLAISIVIIELTRKHGWLDYFLKNLFIGLIREWIAEKFCFQWAISHPIQRLSKARIMLNYEVGATNLEKINTLNAIRFMNAAWNIDVKTITIANCFQCRKIWSDESVAIKQQVCDDEGIHWLHEAISCLLYRNAMDIEHFLNYPCESDAMMESPNDE